MFAGGEAAAVARCEPLFQAMGQRTLRDHLLTAIARGHADLDLCALALVAAENAGAEKPR
ncbi:uncharacterized protein SOCE26_011110 [Sorangium cellulosum]|uniref:Uncharacterized protein n=1 Tax=Sorangium cellulosum TaxID=56 RepID=A0A2L0EK87_SORCE|nr:hypothetical protein [Sorangium cellulosum]AUX39716.1 uncharacterized protein SOCE26_011110 [Sorangium cellulosum]